LIDVQKSVAFCIKSDKTNFFFKKQQNENCSPQRKMGEQGEDTNLIKKNEDTINTGTTRAK